MDLSSSNHLEFAARVQRIEAMRASAQQVVFVGTDEAYCLPRRERTIRRSHSARVWALLRAPLSLALAMAAGVLGHSIGQVLRFHLQGLPDRSASPDMDMLVQLAAGMIVAAILGYVLQLSARAAVLLPLGVVLGLLTFHNAVHRWPAEVSAVTSDAWVSDILAHTTPHSLLWRGNTIPLG